MEAVEAVEVDGVSKGPFVECNVVIRIWEVVKERMGFNIVDFVHQILIKP